MTTVIRCWCLFRWMPLLLMLLYCKQGLSVWTPMLLQYTWLCNKVFFCFNILFIAKCTLNRIHVSQEAIIYIFSSFVLFLVWSIYQKQTNKRKKKQKKRAPKSAPWTRTRRRYQTGIDGVFKSYHSLGEAAKTRQEFASDCGWTPYLLHKHFYSVVFTL